jgi:MFS transporter, UMF1 family
MNSSIVKNDERIINAWAMFDWANSSYALVISTAVFPIYFIKSTSGLIDVFGFKVSNSALYSFAVSFSYIIIALLSPILSGISDRSNRRLFFLKLFTIIGGVHCSLLYFFEGASTTWFGTYCFIMGTIGFAGSLVFYDSFLPLICTEDNYDKVSAKGFTYGYIGSVLLLIFILFMVQKPDLFGITSPTLPSRIGFLLVGVWWIAWSQISFTRLPQDQNRADVSSLTTVGYDEIKKVFKKAKSNANIVAFLSAFFLLSAGVQTVIYLAAIFGEKEIKLETSELIITILLIQLVGIVGAIIFSKISKLIGNKDALIIQVVIWFGICVLAYFTYTKTLFYITACLVGLVMGGVQALARATYSKILNSIPETKDDLTTYFSLYDVLYKFSIVSGTFLYGITNQLTGNMRYSVLVLAVFFISSIWFLRKIKLPNVKSLS